MSYIYDEGWIIDEDTGEVFESPTDVHPDDKTRTLAAKAFHAAEQAKTWKAAEQAFKSALLRNMDDKTMTFPDEGVVATRVTASRKIQDAESIRADIIEAELTATQLRSLAESASKWDEGLLDETVSDLVRRHTAIRENNPYVRLSPLRRKAPERKAKIDD